MDVEEILKNVGFKDKKARVYRACLELGQANAQEIAKKAEVERTSVYALLDSLEKEGLLSITLKKKTEYFIPASPQKLVELLQEKAELMEKYLPLFVSLYKSSDVRPRIRFYEDRESIKEILKDTLTCKERKIRSVSSAKDLLDLKVQPGIFFRDHREGPYAPPRARVHVQGHPDVRPSHTFH